ncbi:MAG TPA: class II aldolase/adducin family protein [Chloroflexota bacterium]|nr:class II aldolase/adducin family protein [Chloroflexota bacterium]
MATTAAEDEAREKLAQCGRALDRLGLYGLGGHISLRIPESELILITPGGGMDKSRLRPEDLTVMDASGKRVAGEYPPPLETPIHTVVHQARPELGCIAHLHAHWATVFSVTNVPLDIVLLPASCLGGPLPTFDEPHLVTDVARAERLRDAMGDAAGVLMRWHGITIVGVTLEEMFTRAVNLEENASLLWEARAIGTLLPLDVSRAAVDAANPLVSARTFNYYVNLERGEADQRHVGRSAAG